MQAISCQKRDLVVELLSQAIEQTSSSTEAIALLKTNKSSFYRWVRRYGLTVKQGKRGPKHGPSWPIDYARQLESEHFIKPAQIAERYGLNAKYVRRVMHQTT